MQAGLPVGYAKATHAYWATFSLQTDHSVWRVLFLIGILPGLLSPPGAHALKGYGKRGRKPLQKNRPERAVFFCFRSLQLPRCVLPDLQVARKTFSNVWHARGVWHLVQVDASGIGKDTGCAEAQQIRKYCKAPHGVSERDVG